MSPTKFEKHIKERLENRKIQPTDNSWDTLSSKLNKKIIVPFRKLFIAASLIGILATVLLVFSNKNHPIEITKTTKDSIPHEVTKDEKTITSTPKIKDKDIIEANIEYNIQKINKNQEFQKQEKQTNTHKINIAEVVTTINKNLDSLPNKIKQPTIADSILIKKEVEQLLTNAKIRIALENIKDSSTIVNHNSLLEEVEIELEIDNTLKNKIYKAIVVNYNKLSKPKKEQN